MGMSLWQSSQSHRCPRWAYIQWKEHANQASSELPEHWGYYGNVVLLCYSTFLKKGSEWKLCNLKDIVVAVRMWVLYSSSTRKYLPRFRRERIRSWSFHWSISMNRYKESLSKWPVIVWFKNLKAYDWVRLGGIFFSCTATCLLMTAICTEYWVKRFVRGIFVFRGLWTDCQLGQCSFLKEIPCKGYGIFRTLKVLLL